MSGAVTNGLAVFVETGYKAVKVEMVSQRNFCDIPYMGTFYVELQYMGSQIGVL